MKRLVLMMVVVLLWAPTLALAGGAGIIKLARPVEKVTAGEAVIYLQALQHNVTPLADAKVSIAARGPNGEVVTAQAALDPAFGSENVYAAKLPLGAAGPWTLTARADHWVIFPELSFEVEVLAASPARTSPRTGMATGAGIAAAAALGLGVWAWRRRFPRLQ